MHLSKLRIYGFKSFAHKVEVSFPKDGITSVVGPNGCGKSNIVDAIRWVMGEQKPRALRSSKMEDVIFSGTAQRPAMQMAEVSLLINNDRGVLPDGHSQILLTRRTYRNGESEYILNNQVCRLRDIQHLFYDTGMGAASYSLMEARMIDSVLSEKDGERRVLFEEAGGISKYKKQRDESRRQLERTSVDLERVHDNLRHTRQSVAVYERQARKAEKWREMQKAFSSLDLSYQGDRYRRLQQDRETLEKKVSALDRLGRDSRAQLATRETELEKKKLEILECEKSLSGANQTVANLEARGVALTNDVQRARDRIGFLRESIGNRRRDREHAAQRIHSYARERKALRRSLEEDRGRLAVMEAQTGESQRSHLDVLEEYGAYRTRAQELSELRVGAYRELSESQNRLGGLVSERDWTLKRRDQIAELRARCHERLSRCERELDVQHAAKRKLDESLARTVAETDQLERRRRVGLGRREGLEAQRRDVERRIASLESKLAVFERLGENPETAGGRRLLQSTSANLRGVLSEMLTGIPDQWAPLVDRCAGQALQALVLGAGGGVGAVVEALRESGPGRAWFFALADHGAFRRSRPDLAGRKGFRAWLCDLLQAPSEFAGALEYLVGNCAVVDDLRTAQRLASENAAGDIWFVTPTGDGIHCSGMAFGGQPDEGDSGALELRMERERVRAELSAAVEERTRCEGDAGEIASELEAVDAGRRDLDRRGASAREEMAAVSRETAGLESTLRSVRGEVDAIQKEEAPLLERLEELDARIGELSQEVGEREERRNQLESQYLKVQATMREVERKKEDLDQGLRTAEKARAELTARIAGEEHKLQHLEESEKEQASLQVRMDLDGQEWEAEIVQVEGRIAELTQTMHDLNAELKIESAARDAAQAEYDRRAAAVEAIRKDMGKQNAAVGDIQSRHHEAQLELERVAASMESARQRVLEIHQIDLESPRGGLPSVPYDPGTVEAEINELREKLGGMGNVNLEALDDFEEEKKRLENVQRQYDDLERARAGLQRAIRKLDRVAKEQFLETFAAIRTNFQEVFNTLFEGGQAEVTLEEGVDPLDARIDINARPTGKKMRGVTLLSGGERALTAISLLFSLYLVRRSPYCIMDEVDGPLDDANIGRFVNLLRRFSAQTQFIVVTHNKKTMAASDMLYGVTQEVKGVSRLVSVQLDEAAAYAA